MLRRSFWCLAAFAVVTTSVRAEDPAPPVVAHIKLSGDLDEAPILDDPLLGPTGENFSSKLERIRKAAKDPAVKALYLQLDGLAVGFGKLDELTKAVAEVRKAGKKTFAYLESGDTHDYLLGLACDEVCIPESGWLMLVGLRAEITFYKELFEKLGIQADMLQMGDAKTAAEPFTRTNLSEASRKQYELVLDDFYNKEIVGRIVASRPDRKFTAEQVKKLIDNGPYTAKAAQKAGLIDRMAYPEEMEKTFEKALDVAKVKVVRNYEQKKAEDIDLSSFAGMFKLFAGPKVTKPSNNPKVAVIYATGPIIAGKGGSSLFGGNVCGSTTMVEAIRQADNDKTVKAIVLRVDSPGGSALGSDLIWKALKDCKKPVLASMSDVAGSGGYYVCMSSKKIYAEPGTITGSIGVLGGKLALGGLYEKLGMTTDVISRGANAGILSATTPWTKTEKEAMKGLISDVYDQFLDKALEGRKAAGKTMTREQLVKLAGGRIWTGRQAVENGLIDGLGTLDEVIADARKMAGMDEKDKELLILPKPKSVLDSLLGDLRDSKVDVPALALLKKLPDARQKLGPIDALLQMRDDPVWLMSPYHFMVK